MRNPDECCAQQSQNHPPTSPPNPCLSSCLTVQYTGFKQGHHLWPGSWSVSAGQRRQWVCCTQARHCLWWMCSAQQKACWASSFTLSTTEPCCARPCKTLRWWWWPTCPAATMLIWRGSTLGVTGCRAGWWDWRPRPLSLLRCSGSCICWVSVWDASCCVIVVGVCFLFSLGGRECC